MPTIAAVRSEAAFSSENMEEFESMAEVSGAHTALACDSVFLHCCILMPCDGAACGEDRRRHIHESLPSSGIQCARHADSPRCCMHRPAPAGGPRWCRWRARMSNASPSCSSRSEACARSHSTRQPRQLWAEHLCFAGCGAELRCAGGVPQVPEAHRRGAGEPEKAPCYLAQKCLVP